MSMFCSVRTEFKNPFALMDALIEVQKWTQEQIEFNDIPMTLFGYRGDARNEKANIIIRRKYIGSASNDIGFLKTENGTFMAIISQYDKTKFNDEWMNKLKCSYAFHVVKRTQEAKGRRVTRHQLEDGRQRIEVHCGR